MLYPQTWKSMKCLNMLAQLHVLGKTLQYSLYNKNTLSLWNAQASTDFKNGFLNPRNLLCIKEYMFWHCDPRGRISFYRGCVFFGVSSDHPIISPPKSKTRLLSEVPQPHHCVRSDLAWGGTPTCHRGREGLLMLLFVSSDVLFIKHHPWTVPYYRSYQVLPVLPNSKRPFWRVEWKMIRPFGETMDG